MKTFNLLKSPKTYLIGALAFAVTSSLIACGKGGAGTQPPNNTVFQQCVNCQSIFQGVSNNYLNTFGTETIPTVTITWTFQAQIGMPMQPMQQYNSYYPNTYPNVSTMGVTTYSGPVSAAGVLSVKQPMNLGYCQIPAGEYSMGTVAQGNWNAGIVSNLRLQAVSGSTSIFLTLTQGQVAAKTGSQLGSTWSEIAPVGSIFGNVMFESINGYNCSQSILVK